MSVPHVPTPTRRTVVAAAGAVPLALGLAACGSEDSSDSGSGSSTAPSDSGGSGGKVLAKTSDIPVGGGKVFGDDGVVVTQPTKGDFKAFSSTCTHQGCTVADVSGGTINCPCHGSKFAIEDGSVKHPPASEGLPAEKIKVSGSSIRTA